MKRKGVSGQKVIFILVFVVALLSFASAEPHDQYSSFAKAEFSVNGNSLSASDDIIYNTGYYSVNGAAWTEFTLQGTPYGNGLPWVLDAGTGSLNLPSQGKHYVIVFSCSLVNKNWDCHGDGNIPAKWQLEIIEDNSNPNPNPNPGQNTLCGNGRCDSGETCSLCRLDCGVCPGPGNRNSNYNSKSQCGDGYCDTTEYCGNCAADCNSCPEIECPCGNSEDCVNGVCLQKPTGSGNRYFVATNGNDGASGSITSPWGTWGKAFNAMGPGDVIYIRGGVYTVSGRSNGYLIDGKSGTSSNRITIANYPGEKPVLDFGSATFGTLQQGSACSSQDDEENIYGIKFRRVSHYTLRGLSIRNLWQRDGCDLMTGLELGRNSNMIIENMDIHDIGGNCFSLGSSNIRIYNSDAYNCVDYITSIPPSNPVPGNDGTGYGTGGDTSSTVYFSGCRAWNSGDQGYSSGSIGYTEYKNCWSMNNGVLEGEGHGFKMGWIKTYTGNIQRLYQNCIAANNWAQGFTTNDQGQAGGKINLFSNFAYYNGPGSPSGRNVGGFYLYSISGAVEKRLLRNNIAYKNKNGAVPGAGAYGHDHNSWDSGVDLSDSDFQDLNVGQLYRSRNADGSLPSITFGKPVSGSDLISKGVYVG